MAIESKCSGCGVQLRVADEYAGRQARCPQCGHTYTVAAAETVGQAPIPPQPDSAADTTSSSSSSSEWFLKTPEGQVYGPVTRDVLDDWVNQGRANANCEIRRGTGDWNSAAGVYPQLAASTSAQPQSDNPYSSPTATSRAHMEPHRGALILIFGILGMLVCFVFAPVAWIMGANDLKKINAGLMDPDGRTLTQVGMILGIILTIPLCIGFVIWLVFMVGVGIMGG